MEDARVDGVLRWHGDHAARRAVYNNRARLLSGVARQAFRLRAEWAECSFALILDRGGMRRAWLCGRANIHKRYLTHVAGYNLGLIMRLLTQNQRLRLVTGLAAPVTGEGRMTRCRNAQLQRRIRVRSVWLIHETVIALHLTDPVPHFRSECQAQIPPACGHRRLTFHGPFLRRLGTVGQLGWHMDWLTSARVGQTGQPSAFRQCA